MRHGLHAPDTIEGLDGPIGIHINTHGTSTPVGDVPELRAIRAVFWRHDPAVLLHQVAHPAARWVPPGVQEAIYCLIVLQKGFIAGSANVETLEPAAEGMPLVTVDARDAPIRTRAVQQLRFRHGTNASLVLRR